MNHRYLLLAFVATAVLASPVRRPTAAHPGHQATSALPAVTQAPTLQRRQEDDGAYSYPESGCTYTTFPRETLTETYVTEIGGSIDTTVTEHVLTKDAGCLCAPHIIAGDSTSSRDGTLDIYCATSAEDGSTPTPITSITDPICVATKNADTWSEYSMGDWVSSQATALAPFSTGFAAAVQNELSGLSADSYSCEWSYGGSQCEVGAIANVCSEDPEAAFAAMAIANLVNYLDDIFQALQTVITTMTPTFATFPETFNPNNITTFPGSSDASVIGTASYFVGSLAALIPGVGAITAGSTAAARLGTVGSVSYMAGSGANMANLGGSSSDSSIEVQFLSFAAIQGLLGELAQAMADGFSEFTSSILTDTPPDDLQTATRQLPSILAGGAFAESAPGFSLSSAQNLTAAIAGPGINLLWQYQGTIVAKVNRDNIPIDPCEGDNLFMSDVKHCDSDGNMFILQAKPEDAFTNPLVDDPEKYAVAGFDELSRYNLTVRDITQSAWRNQQEYGPGSSGPDAKDFIDSLIERRPESLAREEYIFFNLWVCDFNEIDMDDTTVSSVGEDECGDKTEDNATCWFYFYLTRACPLQFAPDDGGDTSWPWGNTKILAAPEDCGLVDTDGNSLCEDTDDAEEDDGDDGSGEVETPDDCGLVDTDGNSLCE